MSRQAIRSAGAVALCAGMGMSASAAQVTANWLAPVSGSWTDPTKWSTPQFPNNGNPAGTTYHAVIDAVGGVYTISLGQDVTVDALTIESSDATLEIVSSVIVLRFPSANLAGAMTVRFAFVRMESDFTNAGLITLVDSTIRPDGGALINDGQIIVDSNFSAQIGSNGSTLSLVNQGEVHVQRNKLRLGHAINMGDIFADAGTTLEVFGELVQAGGTVGGAGTLRVVSGGLVGAKGVHWAGDLVISDGAAHLNAASEFAQVSLAGGTLVIDEDMTVMSPFELQNGSVEGPGSLTIGEGGLLELPSMGSGPLMVRTAIATLGQLDWNGREIKLDEGSLLTSGNVSTIGGFMSSNASAGEWRHEGVLNKTTSNPTSLSGDHLMFMNDGVVNIHGGTFTVDCVNETGGDFVVASGATLRLQQAGTWADDARVLGAGSVFLSGMGHEFEDQWSSFSGALNINSGTAAFDGEVVASRVTLSSGVLQGAGEVRTQDALMWTGGAMTGSGRTIAEEGSSATIGLFAPIDLERELVLRGTSSWWAAILRLNGGELVNEGVLTKFQTPGLFGSMQGLAGGGVFVNDGSFVLTGGGEVRLLRHGGDMTIVNAGLVDVQDGVLRLLGSDSTTNDGVYRVSQLGSMEVAGDFANAMGAALSFEVGGMKDRGLSGLMTITGEAALAGTLSVETPEAFSATWGDRWVVMSYASVDGDFDVFDLPTQGFASRSDEFGASDLRWYAERGETEYAVGVSHVADIDHDGLIGFGDLNIIASNFNAFGSWAEGDVDGDGFVGFTDLNVVLSLFNVAAPRSVPGPGGVVVLALAAGAGLRRRRKS